MDKGECVIIRSVDGYVENALKSALGLRVNKIILTGENESCLIFNKVFIDIH